MRSLSVKNHRPWGAESFQEMVVDNKSSYTCIESQANARGAGFSKTQHRTIHHLLLGCRVEVCSEAVLQNALTSKVQPVGHKHWLWASVGSVNMEKSHLWVIMKFPLLETIPDTITREKGNPLQKSQNKDNFYDCTHKRIYIHIRPLLCK